jgi:hypothetical protein
MKNGGLNSWKTRNIPSGYVKIAIKHGPFNHLEIVDLPIKDCDLTLRKL